MRFTGADPGFFLGGGALVSCSTSTPINHTDFFFCRIPSVLENRRSSQGGGVRIPCTLPLDPPLIRWNKTDLTSIKKWKANNIEFKCLKKTFAVERKPFCVSIVFSYRSKLFHLFRKLTLELSWNVACLHYLNLENNFSRSHAGSENLSVSVMSLIMHLQWVGNVLEQGMFCVMFR